MKGLQIARYPAEKFAGYLAIYSVFGVNNKEKLLGRCDVKSVWSESVNLVGFDRLDGDVACDVLIIGGGIAGILCAYFLQEQGVDYLLVEANSIGSGITKNTTAQITAQHELIYSTLIKNSGTKKAKQYLDANLWAIEKYAALCKDIDCNFERKAAYTYTLRDRALMEEEVSAVNSLGFTAEFVEKVALPLYVKGAVKFNNQAQFNPMKFIKAISKKLNIRENTFVEKIKEMTAYTDHGHIKANRIVIATHFPFINAHGLYFAKLFQNRSFVIALEDAPDINGMYVDEGQYGMYFRNYENLLLVGGGDHKTGKIGGGYEELRNFAKNYYPDCKEKYAWATQDCMTLDGVPYIGRYSTTTPNMYVATGFNEWGMTAAMVSARILTELILEKPSDYADVFSPARSMLKKQLFVNGFTTLGNLLYPTTKRCPHLGCALKWNKAEHTWDCPCHGSRFDEEGGLIDNPAMKDATVK